MGVISLKVTPAVWDDLLENALKEMNARKAHYESVLNQKLDLALLREMRIKPYDYPQVRMFGKAMMADSTQASAPDMSVILPSQTYTLNLDLGFDIR